MYPLPRPVNKQTISVELPRVWHGIYNTVTIKDAGILAIVLGQSKWDRRDIFEVISKKWRANLRNLSLSNGWKCIRNFENVTLLWTFRLLEWVRSTSGMGTFDFWNGYVRLLEWVRSTSGMGTFVKKWYEPSCPKVGGSSPPAPSPCATPARTVLHCFQQMISSTWEAVYAQLPVCARHYLPKRKLHDGSTSAGTCICLWWPCWRWVWGCFWTLLSSHLLSCYGLDPHRVAPSPAWNTIRQALSPGQRVLPTQAKSSQVTKSKLASAGGQTVLGSRVRSQEKKLSDWLHSHPAITKQIGENWLKLAEVAKRWKTWLELGKRGAKLPWSDKQLALVARTLNTHTRCHDKEISAGLIRI